jgi:hypothetical protein
MQRNVLQICNRQACLCLCDVQIILPMQNFSDVIDRFGYAGMAALLAKPPGTVSSWKTRNLIPPEFWDALVQAAPASNVHGLTHQLLARFAAERRVASQAPGADEVRATGGDSPASLEAEVPIATHCIEFVGFSEGQSR